MSLKLRHRTLTFLALLTLTLKPCFTSKAAAPSKDEVASTAAWFDGLQWPDLRGKPYIEVMFGRGRIGSKIVDGPKVRGFLLSEDAQSLTLFSDGTVTQHGSFFGGGWPFTVEKIAKTPPEADADSKLSTRIIELADAVKEVLAELRRPKDQDEMRHSDFGRKISDQAAVFILARCCAREGRADLAE